jgi:hypothetical protein
MQPEDQRETRLEKTEQNLREMWATVQHTSIYVMGVPERQERGENNQQIQETQ